MSRLASLALVVLSGCATAATRQPRWVPATSPYVAQVGRFEVDLPAGWMRANIPNSESLVLTRDGTAVQRIIVQSSELGKPLGGTHRTVVAGMSAEQLGNVVIEDSDPRGAWREIRVLENTPVTLSGRRGFRLLAAYRDDDGLKCRLVVYGLVTEARFFWLVFNAPQRHYFDVYLPVFEELVRSFRLDTPPPSA